MVGAHTPAPSPSANSGRAVSEPSPVGAVHFWIGCVAVVAGFAALAARKGNRVHRAAGAAFTIAMLLLTASGLWLSVKREILFTVFLSAIAFHSVVTGWAAAAFETPIGRFATKTSPVFSGAFTLGAVYSGLFAAQSPGGMVNDLPPGAFYVVAATGFVLAIYDVAFAFAKNVSQAQRLTRHLWRMGFSFFLATSIFFLGNNHVLPEALRTPTFLIAPVMLVVLWSVFYAFRMRFSEAKKRIE